MQTQSTGSFNIVPLALAARAAVIENIPLAMGQGGPAVAGWPTLVCADGFSLSVQAGVRKFSTPAVDGADHYSHVEVAHTIHCEALAPYGDEDEGIYQFVPVDVVEALLKEHGGLDIPATIAYRARVMGINKRTLLS